ncbi:MAG: aminoacyl-tRNA hydrolase [Sandaracinaceae bacterium]|nr:aminoacyl-tRNA hydrolase [Sandaracinaceae bacterium]
MHLVVGLGNPGPKYRGNRHNVGFMVVDRLARAAGVELRDKFKGLHARARVAGQDVALLEPTTFMNLSGESVQPAMRFFKVEPSELVVVHDELDLPFGTVRLKQGGGAAGHNGLRSIIQHCGGADFARVRIGIGRPPHGSVESWVLSDFDALESAELDDVLQQAALAVEMLIRQGLAAAMNAVNVRKKD